MGHSLMQQQGYFLAAGSDRASLVAQVSPIEQVSRFDWQIGIKLHLMSPGLITAFAVIVKQTSPAAAGADLHFIHEFAVK